MKAKTKLLYIGNVPVGGNAPISIQSMTNTPTTDIPKTLKQIQECAALGCDLIRVGVPDTASASAIKKLTAQSPIPIIADIHFDYRLALESIKNGAAAIRINPGNIAASDSENRIRLIAEAAKAAQIPIRVGVNAGSLDADILKKYNSPVPQALVESALRQCQILEQFSFHDIKVSIKSSSVRDTFEACRLFQKKNINGYPLHLGVTETGIPEDGIIKSAVGIGALLLSGIGSTIRVSLSASPQEEVKTALKILEACGLRQPRIEFISCPTCSRTTADVSDFVIKLKQRLKDIQPGTPLKIAVMGCMVNGPGEAAGADIAIVWSKHKAVIFKQGEPVKTVFQHDAMDTLTSFILNQN